MKEMVTGMLRHCPLCGMHYRGYPALSRKDSSLICTDCGSRQAMESIGIAREERERILAIIHKHQMA